MPPFPKESLTRACGVSVSRLDRLFVQSKGITSRRCFENRRFLTARSVVEAGGDLPIKALAYQLGFKQLSHFSTWFKRHAGSPPLRYRSGSGR